MFRSFLAGLAAMLLMLTGAHAQAPAPTAQPTPEQRRVIEQIVRDYLVNNPEVLREAFASLERREQEQQARAQVEAIEKNATQLFGPGGHAVLGNPRGDVTIVEFFDYNCGFCKRGHDDMRAILQDDPGVRWVLKEFPVLGPGSIEAAQISVQLMGHPRFAEFHSRLLLERGPVDRAKALAVARSLGMDVAALDRGAAGDGPRQILQDTYSLANTLGLSATPIYVMGREVVVGAVGVDALRERIAALRRCGQTTC